MTTYELIVMGAGLVGGYWLVSKLMVGIDEQKREDRTGPKSPDQRSPSSKEPEPSWYQVLEVSPSASMDQIEAAYKRRMSEYHPDKVARMGQEIREVAERKCKQINAAYALAKRL